jgi:DNA-binding FadR family transcriptional regulator
MSSIVSFERDAFAVSAVSRVRRGHLLLDFNVADASFIDCLEVRDALEPLVCREAAAHCRAADAKALRETVGRMRKQTGNPRAFLRLNWDLHRRLASMGTNAPLRTSYLTLLDFVDDGLDDVSGDGSFDAEESLRVHEELVEAVIDGNPKRLSRAIERHMPPASRRSENRSQSVRPNIRVGREEI